MHWLRRTMTHRHTFAPQAGHVQYRYYISKKTMEPLGPPRGTTQTSNPQTPDTAIGIKNLVKTFGPVTALNHLDMTIKTGEVHGFLGPNGAGKSTTIRILLGLLRCDSGNVTLLGGDPLRDAVDLHRRLAYVPGEVNLWPNLTGGEVIDLLGALRGRSNKTRRDDLIRRFELDPRKQIRTYSKGNRQKVAIIAALAADVELYIFDEPTSGLDPLMEAVFQECVQEIKRDGRTVLLSSHILAEVESLCDSVTIIREGAAVESGTLQTLRHLTRTSLVVETATPFTADKHIPGLHNFTLKGTTAKFQVDTDKLDTVIKALSSHNVRSLTCTPPTLEELFMRHYEPEPLSDDTPAQGQAS